LYFKEVVWEVLLKKNSFIIAHLIRFPGSMKEQQFFAEIQSNFGKQFEQRFPDKLAAKTIVSH